MSDLGAEMSRRAAGDAASASSLLSPSAEQVRPENEKVVARDVFFLVNQQAIVNQRILAALTELIADNKQGALFALREAFGEHTKLGQRLDALITAGSAYVP